MSTIHLHQTTTLTPEQYIAGLTDFGPGRAKLFGNSADEYLKVHHRGPRRLVQGSHGVRRLDHDVQRNPAQDMSLLVPDFAAVPHPPAPVRARSALR